MEAALAAYRARLPARDVVALAAQLPGWPSVETQGEWARAVLQDPVAVAFPPGAAYTRSVAALVASAAGAELCDEVCEVLADMASTPGGEDMGYRSFLVPEGGDSCVSVRVAHTANAVGLRLWEAGFFLVEWAVATGALRECAHVLELGSGVGLTGLLLAAGSTARMTLTDGVPEVVANLRHTVEVNEAQTVAADVLEWGAPVPDGVDMVVAADVTYDVAEFPALVQTLRSAPRFVIAATERNPETFAAFLAALEAAGIDGATVETPDVPQLFSYSRETPIRVVSWGVES